MMIRLALLTALLFVPAACSGGEKSESNGPLSPQQALNSFRLDPDFRIEVFAAEPDMLDPVEMVFDEQGRVYVAEMADYPEDPLPGAPPRGRIRLLEDSDGDGRVDRSTLFADRLLQVSSILPWKGGVLAAAAPDILYLKDSDGDGRSDIREVLFTGFALVNPESRITNLRFGLDNWIYAANNGQQGEITFSLKPDLPPVQLLGADFRFRLDRGLFEAASGPTQFGQTLDDWGNRFITHNTIHVRHVVIPRRYLSRNPYLAAGAASQDISDHGRPSARMYQLTAPQHWRRARTEMRQRRYRENRLDEIRELNPSTELAAGYFTAAAGGTIYHGDTWGEEFRGNLFTGDVAGNLVHRDLLEPEGATFRAGRAQTEQQREFLASTDSWFRPCNFTVGPDGNLYVVDMYREFIETPESVPEELKRNMDFYQGDRLGRIYRISRRSFSGSSLRPSLGGVSGGQLVGLLEHRNGWWRLTAHRLLLERQDRAVVPALRDMLRNSTEAVARLHALYLLEGLSSLEVPLLEKALRDPEPGVRIHALRLAEEFPGLLPRLLPLVSDPSPQVRFQLVLSLGEFSGAPVLDALSRLMLSDGGDAWFQTALLTSDPGSSLELVERLLGAGFFDAEEDSRQNFIRRSAAIIGARRNGTEIRRWLSLFIQSPTLRTPVRQTAALEGLGNGLEVTSYGKLSGRGVVPLLTPLLNSSLPELQAQARRVARHFEIPSLMAAARSKALDPAAPPEQRIEAIRTLSGEAFDAARPTFEQILDSGSNEPVVEAAIRALGSYPNPPVARVLISRWQRLTAGQRQAALNGLLSHQSRIARVLEAVDNNTIERSLFEPRLRELLRINSDAAIRERARRLFPEETDEGAGLLAIYRPSLALSGDSQRGQVQFADKCARCHFVRGGKRIGPDLSGVSSHTRIQLLQAVLDPSANIQAGYTTYLVSTENGELMDGLIVSETPATLTLRSTDGTDRTLLRKNIREVRASSVSLMPSGLEAGMTPQDMADLIAYLQGD